MPTSYSENDLIEQPAIALFGELGYETANCFSEKFGKTSSTLGRGTKTEVLLIPRLKNSIKKLNPELPDDAVELAIDLIAKDRSAMSLAHANREVHKLIREGIRISYQNSEGRQVSETVRVIDWKAPENNDFFLASQFWVAGGLYTRRCDLVAFVNGIPLVFIELKSPTTDIQAAYRDNLTDYKQTVPQLFWYNGFIILSNGSKTKVGSVTAGWEHFADWKRINSEGERGVISLETMIRGTCDKTRLLDLIENFTLFHDTKSGFAKITAKNHQYLGVNNALNGLQRIKENQGRLGVFWHTQGSGKSYSMVFFSQKVLRKVPGNWTFLVVTDRHDLDTQIYKNFRNSDVANEDCQAESGEHLKQLLQEDHRFIFTLIQKFGAKKGERFPKLSDRSDIIVMTDEAHRSQYDTLAMNMRNALPNAAFIGFTGTPLMAGEEKTKQVFGDYVSVYNFRQSIEDGATVPLFYENRIPELQLANENFKDELEELIENAELDDEQELKLQREFATEYQLITREDRLEKIADDLVRHFVGREEGGKAMMVCIDKITAVKMHDKVKSHWSLQLGRLKAEASTVEPVRKAWLMGRIAFMESTDMAVVISQQQNEVEYFREKGYDILPHRHRMVHEDLETKFKEANDPFRLVFVCAMWLTGFDAPSVSTIYLDKPMKNHTLMQTIARANRVFGQKNNGLIVDYVGVFRNLQKALAIYGSESGNGSGDDECPIQKKEQLVEELRLAVTDARAFCDERSVNIDRILQAQGFTITGLLDEAAIALVDKQVVDAVDDAVEQVIVNDDLKKQFLMICNRVKRLYKAILPDPLASEFAPFQAALQVLGKKVKLFTPQVTIGDVMGQIGDLLDESISTVGYVIHNTEKTSLIDLSKIDFEALKAMFNKGRKRTEAEKLRQSVGQKLAKMVKENKTRIDFLEKFQKLIEEYNSGLDVEGFFQQLIDFIQQLTVEEQRAVAEQLSEEELTIFDILTKPEITLEDEERKDVKQISRKVLQTLKEAKLVLDWRKKPQASAEVLTTVKHVLDELPRAYSKELYDTKCETVFKHIYETYPGDGSEQAISSPRIMS